MLALAVSGCSKVDVERSGWVLGTFSDTPANYSSLALLGVTQYEFREDGTLALSAVGCGGAPKELIREYQWRTDGDLRVIVEIPAPENTVFQEWVVTQGEECNTLQIDQIQDGRSISGPLLWRGAVCMSKLPPCEAGHECASCTTVWCDEPPPDCEE
jgi:hypothetical protein